MIDDIILGNETFIAIAPTQGNPSDARSGLNLQEMKVTDGGCSNYSDLMIGIRWYSNR